MFSLLFFTPNPGVWTSAVWVEPALYLLVLINFLEISLKRILKRNQRVERLIEHWMDAWKSETRHNHSSNREPWWSPDTILALAHWLDLGIRVEYFGSLGSPCIGPEWLLALSGRCMLIPGPIHGDFSLVNILHNVYMDLCNVSSVFKTFQFYQPAKRWHCLRTILPNLNANIRWLSPTGENGFWGTPWHSLTNTIPRGLHGRVNDRMLLRTGPDCSENRQGDCPGKLRESGWVWDAGTLQRLSYGF